MVATGCTALVTVLLITGGGSAHPVRVDANAHATPTATTIDPATLDHTFFESATCVQSRSQRLATLRPASLGSTEPGFRS
jgi:hypothetical protein